MPENKYIKLNLIGRKIIEINTNKIIKSLIQPNIIKIKDKTELEIDIEAISKQKNLKGLYVKRLLEKQEKEPENRKIIEMAIEIGLNSF